MRNKLLTAALAFLLSACSQTITTPQHVGTDTLPPANKELRSVEKSFTHYQFSPAVVTQAVKEKKIIILYFHSEWCRFCQKMDKEVWKHPEIAEVVSKAYTFIDIDIGTAEGHALYKKYTEMFGTETVIPLTVFIFPRINPDDEKVQKDFIIPSPTDVNETDNMFRSSLFLTAEGYIDPMGAYTDMYRLGIVYSKKLKKAEPTSTVVDTSEPMCKSNAHGQHD